MPEKKSIPTSQTSTADKGAEGNDLGRANYSAEQARDAVIIFASGVHPTPGYTDFFEQSPLRIFPPQFIFHSIPPTGMVPQVLSPFSIWVMFGATEPVETVTVHDADGAHEIKVKQISEDLAVAQQQATWVSGSVVRAAGRFSQPTTLAVGEEGGGPTTLAVGEEDVTGPTTMATGEEGPGPTTMATGEEEARIATTLALGEEEPHVTTMAIGEEGATTLRLGEEGATTMALGEEGTGPIVRSSPFGGF
ncbi:MAG TPA: hypothetical protein VHH35_03460 [Pyrinomonadaceae bacterium]|nr:hypothetical protein [Pyrinomonadaceae bacterium]